MSGLSQLVGTRTSGRPAHSPAMVVPAPPVVTSAEQRGSNVSCASQSRTCTFGACPEIEPTWRRPVVRIAS